jgi:hypothetical protein
MVRVARAFGSRLVIANADALLKPLTIKGLTIRNRVMSTGRGAGRRPPSAFDDEVARGLGAAQQRHAGVDLALADAARMCREPTFLAQKLLARAFGSRLVIANADALLKPLTIKGLSSRARPGCRARPRTSRRTW